MIELPESYVLAEQISTRLAGKVIANAVAGHTPHGFASYTGNPADYQANLTGKTISGADVWSGGLRIFAGDLSLLISTPVRFYAAGEALPAKHQLCIGFSDASAIVCIVQMWGAMMYAKTGMEELSLPVVYRAGPSCPSPLADGFDRVYFATLAQGCAEKYSVKALLATEQRIPGFGNGVLQDVLFNAKLNPKRKLKALRDQDMDVLFQSVKQTLLAMVRQGGRNTERDLFGQPGGYQTILCSKTIDAPCPVCGGRITREAYMGGNVYYCPACQPL
jgi:formamidopyrimidine-DNA glycosylase